MADLSLWIAVGTMLAVYVLIATERLHRATAALLGVAVVLAAQFILGEFVPAARIWGDGDAGELFTRIFIENSGRHIVDLNVILLLLGMMVIVAITAETRIFQWTAFQMYRKASGRPMRLLLWLCALTAFLSAWIDNVTTMLLVAPVTIEVCLVLGIRPLTFLIPEALASNVGGALTLVGDPPNILVGSYAGLTFTDFLVGLTPSIGAAFVVFLVYVRFRYKRELGRAAAVDVHATIARLREECRIPSWRAVNTSLGVLGGVVLLFLLHSKLGMEVAVPALIGAGVLLALSGRDAVKVLAEVEWPTLVFIMMLFVMVGAVEATGALRIVADGIADLAGGNVIIAIVLLIWVSAVLSAIVDNIPFAATMLPVVGALTAVGGPFEGNIGLWWALLIGVDLGGNATIVGASANIVTAGIAEKAGYPVTFVEWFKHGAPVAILTCLVGTIVLIIEWGFR